MQVRRDYICLLNLFLRYVDWSNADIGLTEFLINQGAEAEVAFTESADEFLTCLSEIRIKFN